MRSALLPTHPMPLIRRVILRLPGTVSSERPSPVAAAALEPFLWGRQTVLFPWFEVFQRSARTMRQILEEQVRLRCSYCPEAPLSGPQLPAALRPMGRFFQSAQTGQYFPFCTISHCSILLPARTLTVPLLGVASF